MAEEGKLIFLHFNFLLPFFRPQGSNLFVFHIPNNMTNMDMFQLFSPCGNLISVRIMVEKDTGRSRGFGFVSYDNPESAALAIKELNGFAIGNKRLKVQHKQIRPRDIQQERDHIHGYSGISSEGSYDRQQHGTSLPPSGPGAANTWLDGPSGSEIPGQVPDSQEGKPDEGTEQTSTSTNGEAPLSMSNDGSKGMASPLASLGTLQDSLPEAPGRQE
jgi:CUG-BP- and ETR3-like factor